MICIILCPKRKIHLIHRNAFFLCINLKSDLIYIKKLLKLLRGRFFSRFLLFNTVKQNKFFLCKFFPNNTEGNFIKNIN